ncbi:MAG: PAS domain-containing protein [Synechocystis sp.]|nr:PAS domain-containing protein [Synechocystis sp.]
MADFVISTGHDVNSHPHPLTVPAEQERLVNRIALRIRESLELADILQTCVTELRQVLVADRLIVYQFQPDWSGLIVAESVADGIASTLGNRIDDSCFKRWQDFATWGETAVIANDIYAMGYQPCHVKLLEQYGVTANMVQTIYVEKQLWGLLIAHHCQGARQWQPPEAQILNDLSIQLAIAIQQSNLITALNTEIEERKQLEHSLKHIQAQYEKAEKLAKLGYWELNLKTNDLYWSPEVFRLFERDAAAFRATYENFLAVVHPADRDGVCQAYQAHLNTRKPYQLVHRLQMPDGRIKYVREECETTYAEDGTPLVSIGTVQDVTAEVILKQETEQKQRLADELRVVETVLDEVIGGYWDWDLVTNAEYLSVGFRRMFGYDADVNGTDLTSFTEIIFPEDLILAQNHLERHVQSRGQIPYSLEVRYRHKDGSTVWVLCTGKVIEWDQNGKPLRMVGGHIDITQQKQNEQALKESQAFIQGITDASPDVLYVFDLQTYRNIYINHQSTQALGYSPEEIQVMGDHFLAILLHPEDVDRVLKHFEQVQRAQPGMVLEIECRLRTKDGHWRWFMGRTTSFKRNGAGEVEQIVGVAQDITQRKLVEEQLRYQTQQERVLTTLLERTRSSLNLNEVLTATVESLQQVLQTDRLLVYKVFENGTGAAIAETVSPPWEKLLDRVFPEEVFPKQNYQRYVNGRVFALYDREAQSKMVLPCLADFLAEIQVKAKLVVPIIQGDRLWGLLIAHQCDAPRNWQDWEIQFLRRVASQLAIAIQQANLYRQLELELTERKIAQEQLTERNQQLAGVNQQLARATRLKDEFLANMSHELRTPLNAILGLTEGVLEEVYGPLTEKQHRSLQTVERSGQHLLSLINDILDVAKIEAGEVELDCREVSIKSICNTSLLFIKQQAQKKNIRILRQIPDTLPHIWGDERRLHQIFINLLSNSVKFTPDGGTITLAVNLVAPSLPPKPLALTGIERVSIFQPAPNPDRPQSVSRVEISITDTGIGIAPENLDKLFQPFIQIDSALNRQYEGTGLGLSLVKQLVELHGGEVSVFSRLDIGSTFTVSLPVIDPHPATTSVTGETLAPTPSATLDNPNSYLILLAEDNEANAATFLSYLEAKGYRVIHAFNGEGAIALIRQEKPDLVLMDIQMPVMDGFTAIEIIRNELGLTDVPIIALTALAMDGDEEKCMAIGANDYLSKPVKLKELVTLMERHLNPHNH